MTDYHYPDTWQITSLQVLYKFSKYLNFPVRVVVVYDYSISPSDLLQQFYRGHGLIGQILVSPQLVAQLFYRNDPFYCVKCISLSVHTRKPLNTFFFLYLHKIRTY